MIKLYKVTDGAMNKFFVRAEDEEEAWLKYEVWRDTPGNIENPSARPVIAVDLVGSPIGEEIYSPWGNYID